MRGKALCLFVTHLLHLSIAGLQRSFSKEGEIYLASCEGRDQLFVGDPHLWPSCADALEYTWTTDTNGDIRGLRAQDRLKLTRSNGYCPHLRCQLGNISNADPTGSCPAGMCYMKLENAAVSFGACCFINGHFNSKQMIGYFNKTQPTPKPIYKTNRIVLGPDPTDESYERFINANEVYPGIIATQCPLLGYPDGFQNTLNDVKTMIIQQNISLWVSLAPVISETDVTIETLSSILATQSLKCNVFPLLLMRENFGHVSMNSLKSTDSGGYWNISYTLRAYVIREASSPQIIFQRPDDTMNWLEIEHRVEHLWYMRWKDFDIPVPGDEELVREMADYAAGALQRGRRLSVNCLSGRGRSGTFITIIVGVLEKITTVSELVDIIVRLRRSRDGLVEIPKQLRFIVRALGLGNTSSCGLTCRYLAAFDSSHTHVISAFVSGIVFSVSLYVVFRFYMGSDRVSRFPNVNHEESKVNAFHEKEPLLRLKSR